MTGFSLSLAGVLIFRWNKEFHSIQLGDLDLWHEIWLDHGSGVVNRLPRTCLRKIYAARIGGRAAAMTAAVYEGPTAEEVC